MSDDSKYFLDRSKAYGLSDELGIKMHQMQTKALLNKTKRHPYLTYKNWASTQPEVISSFQRAEPDARVFVLERKQLMEFEATDWDDFNPDFCVPPYKSFFIRPAYPLPLKYGENFDVPRYHNDENIVDKGQLFLMDIFVDCTDEEEWIIIENLEWEDFGGQRRMPYSIGIRLRIESGTCSCIKWPEEWLTNGKPQWYSVRQKYYDEKTRKMLYVEAQISARNVISFLHLVNNRKANVQNFVPEDEPKTRLEKRQAARTGWSSHNHYKIIIPQRKNVRSLVSEAINGKSLRYRRPHWVRGHTRKIKTRDELVRVKPHKRCGEPEYIPEYDVGKIKREDLEHIAS
jgi:hypothetical protein